MSDNTRYSPEQERLITEIKRIAQKLHLNSLSKRDFDQHHQLGGVTTARYSFGSWNEAIVAAGLIPNPPGASNRDKEITDEELLREIIRLHEAIGRVPSEAKLSAIGRYSLTPYRDRWGTFNKAREAAYDLFGKPQ